MIPTSKNSPADTARAGRRLADILTLACMATSGLLIGWALLGPQEGMEALGIIIPWGIAVMAHTILSLPALILAWKSGRYFRNAFIFSYFVTTHPC
ncbi:MAG TPA: hypothetical protein DHV36_03030 [Desulfobacteraceae bacterium]|nr:hypothetical protein [Desulfobacteraceae bacterium]|tara:strand:+ start:1909 stop:2196 length:288 start_codon:yes stop_codon:yes gene_type:complete